MSDSWRAWKPRIEEPSNIWPSVKKSAPTDTAGTLKCCITPGRSQNLTSTNLTPSSLMNFRTSSALVNIQPPRRKSAHECRVQRTGHRDTQVDADARTAGFLVHVSSVARVLLALVDCDECMTRSRTWPGRWTRGRLACDTWWTGGTSDLGWRV